MRIVIQAFSNDDDTKGLEWSGDTVAELETFDEAHDALNSMERRGI